MAHKLWPIIECASLIKGTHERAPGPYLPEFQAVCYIYLGRKGELAALMAANIIVVGALITYYVLMSKENFRKNFIEAHFFSRFFEIK